jgi:hypothetical protein
MGNVNESVWSLLVFAIVLALVLFKLRKLRQAATAFAEKWKEEMKNFPRGGPPTPMHPSPVDDDALLRRRSSKNVQGVDTRRNRSSA